MARRVVTLPRIEIDPEERKRRLSRVYTILLDLAAFAEAAERDSAGEPAQATVCDISDTAGEKSECPSSK